MGQALAIHINGISLFIQHTSCFCLFACMFVFKNVCYEQFCLFVNPHTFHSHVPQVVATNLDAETSKQNTQTPHV